MWKNRISFFEPAICIALAICTVAPGGPAHAADFIEVVPTGDPLQDIPNVQDAVAAVEEGGTVLLRASAIDGTPTPFNFGQVFPEFLEEAWDARDENSVNITQSLRIRGEILDDDDEDDRNGEDEDGADGEVQTTIFGGFEPIRVIAPDVDVVIEKINFTCARYKVIQVIAGGNVVIRNNRFGKVTFFETDLLFGTPRTFGVAISGDTGAEAVELRGVVIERNQVDLNPGTPCPGLADDPDQDDLGSKLAFGLFTASVDGDIVIQDNIIRNTARFGIGLTDSRGTTKVRGNIVEPGTRAFGNPFFFGTVAINSNAGFFRPDEGQRGLTIISRNRVICENKDCTGIAVGDTAAQRGRAVIRRNHIVMDVSEPPDLPFAAGIEIFIGDSVIARNKIKGAGNFAILLEDDVGAGVLGLADDNRVVGNRVRKFTPLAEDFFGTALPEPVHYALFGASRNLLRGDSGLVFDLGDDNTIKGGLSVVE